MISNNIKEKVFKIYIDFDGTITTQDVGAAFLNTFGIPEEIERIVKDWIDEKITSPQSWHLMLATIPKFDEEIFNQFLSKMNIDSTFKKFVEYCKSNEIEIRILSDGLDLYIKKILARENLNDIKFYCNKTSINSERKISVQFPFGDEECKFCGNCKRNHILTTSADDDYTIYIGDGYSDKCPIEYCDFIFAKDSLLKYCEVNRITYFPFKNFDDVTRKIDELRAKKRLKKKHQAEIKRRDVYLQG